jgi:hypothetical protein
MVNTLFFEIVILKNCHPAYIARSLVDNLWSFAQYAGLQIVLKTLYHNTTNFEFYRLCYSMVATVMIPYILFLNFSIKSVLWQPTIHEKYLFIVRIRIFYNF